MSAKSIHIVVSDLFSGDGIGNFVLAVADLLRQQEYKVHLYAERFDNTLSNVRSYADFLSCVNPEDLLFYQYSNYDPFFEELMSVACRKIVYYHNITPGKFFGSYSSETAELLEKGRLGFPFLRSVDALVANSFFSLLEVAPFVARGAIQCVFPPFLSSSINFSMIRSAPRPQCVPPRPYLLSLGRVVPHKRIMESLHIFYELRSHNVDMNFIVAGSHYAPYVEEVRAEVYKLGLEDYVFFTDKITRKEVHGLLAHASGLLQSSAHEGFCLPLLEAMLAGIPIFAHYQDAMVETLGGTGIAFDAQKSKEAALQIKNTLTNKDCLQHVIHLQNLRAKVLLSIADETFLIGLFKVVIENCRNNS